MLIFALGSLAAPPVAAAQALDLAVGQEWSVKDTTAKVVIGKIETLGRADVVSVSILDVPTDRGPTTFGHAPFEKAALVASLDRLLAVGVATDPNFEPGYQQWRAANGGIFTVNVAQAIAVTLQTIGRAAPQPAAPAER
jgi:hypothetical protein